VDVLTGYPVDEPLGPIKFGVLGASAPDAGVDALAEGAVAPERTVQRGRQAAAERLGRFWRAWRRSILVAAGGTVLLRLVTEWIGLVGRYGTQFPHVVARHPAVLVDVWGRWDAGYYLSIAQHGYPGHSVAPGQAAYSMAFAPLYPVLIRVAHTVFGLGWVAAAEAVSFAALFVALALIGRLCELDRGPKTSGTTSTLLLAWPTAFFFLAPYPEAVALALGTGSFLAARRRHWLWAGALAAGATMTKFYLVLLVVPLAMEAWLCYRPGRHRAGAAEPPTPKAPRRWTAPVVGVMAPIVVFGCWLIFSAVHTGDALASTHAQAAGWHRQFSWPWVLFGNTASDLVHLRFLDTSTASVAELFDAVTFVALAVAAVVVYVRVRRSYGVLLGLAWCVFAFEPRLLSQSREVLVLFPFFIGLGVWTQGHPWRERVLLALFIPCAFFLIERFVTGAFAG
jgi:hypothetical protein